MNKIIIFCFAGRKKYLDIQLVYILNLLKKNPNIEYHLWNFSRNKDDNNYLQEVVNLHNQIKLFNNFYEGDNINIICNKRVGIICSCIKCRVGKWTEPYKYYSNKKYENTIFIKLDDDIVFISIDKINNFIETITNNPNQIISSNVINNGVCSFYNENIKKMVIDSAILNNNSSLNDFWYLCTNKNFFNLSHDYFINEFNKNNLKLCNLEEKKISIERTRFSINTIGFTYDIMCKITDLLGNQIGMNDEELISRNFDILICNTFLNVHFHFSDQRVNIIDEEESKYLILYKNISNQFISRHDV
jgi:hypothetical protein